MGGWEGVLPIRPTLGAMQEVRMKITNNLRSNPVGLADLTTLANFVMIGTDEILEWLLPA